MQTNTKIVYATVIVTVAILFTIIALSSDFRDRQRLENVLGVEESINNYPLKCYNLNLERDKIAIIIDGFGNSFNETQILAEKIAKETEYGVIKCINPGFETLETDANMLAKAMILNGSSYHGLMVKQYRKLLASLKDKSEITLVGFSMGSHAAMYIGALSNDVDRTIAIAGLTKYRYLNSHAVAQIVPGINKEFNIREVSCLNNNIIWLVGLEDGVFQIIDLPSSQFNCDNAQIIEFEGGHEIPDELVINLLEDAAWSNNKQ